MSYCETTDLKYGDMAIPSYISLETYVSDAADEMDSVLGQVYVTPIALSVNDPVQRPSALLLKSINTKIATGRLLMYLASANEDIQVHAYGLYLLKEGIAQLNKIMDGDYTLIGAEKLPGSPDADNSPKGPMIYNEDADSLVKDFYQSMAPSLTGLPTRPTGVHPYSGDE